ncbi:MAG: propanediol/glycerol family dehydratase large subunit, partial [Propionibacteriaceae bacterium]|nr:propanediol/glycerol family dehydratase large subunit [Propionibacteriaceae bacterium]
IGAQVGRPGILTQCAVEEATELDLGMRGFTAYAETVSVYGTEPVFIDGDDTPWSKGFLASCYASRGLKMRFTSGTGSEVQMGYAEGKSMLYLEARCQYITKACGSQGTQNGSVSCCGVPAAVPSGIRAMLAENLIAMALDLECASSNDQTFTHSDLRRVARSLMQFAPGTDFICSGYSATPNYDNMFAGSNWDADDFDDWCVIQRDLKVDGGLSPVGEDEVVAVRNKAAKVLQALFRELGLTEITDAEVEAATYARGSQDMPDRNVVEDLKAADGLLKRGITAVDFVKALYKAGFEDVADSVYKVQLQRVSGDYLHTASILTSDFKVISAVNYPNDYAGPKTGYQISDERWAQIKAIRQAIDPESI